MAHHYSTVFGYPSKVVALLDVDSFECQIYDRWYPRNKFSQRPGVMADQTGRIVSVTYPAKALGITRDMRVDSARVVALRQNVNLAVVKKANDREKPDAKEGRYACWEILDAITEFRKMFGCRYVVELSSVDEFYLDLTEEVSRLMEEEDIIPGTKVGKRTFLELEEGRYSGGTLKGLVRYRYENIHPEDVDELMHEKRLYLGALLMQEINAHVRKTTQLIASVGVGGNKIMAKMAVNLNKPNAITAFPNSALARLGDMINIEKIPGFGSVFGQKIIDKLKIRSMNELARTEIEELEQFFNGTNAMNIYLKSKGLLEELVKEKLMNEEVSCGKYYREHKAMSLQALRRGFQLLVEEMIDRLDEEGFRHMRYPLFLRFGIQFTANHFKASSRCADVKDKKSEEKKSEEEKNEEEKNEEEKSGEEKKEANSRSWSSCTPYIFCQKCNEYVEHGMELFFNDKPFNIKTSRIDKLEVRAKNFEFFQSNKKVNF